MEAPWLGDRLYLLSSVGGLIRTAFLPSFLLSGCLLAFYSRLFISIENSNLKRKKTSNTEEEI